MTYSTQLNLLASTYGSGTYDSSDYNGSATGTGNTGTGSSSSSSGGTTTKGILTNTGFDIALILSLAVAIMFVAMLSRYWKKPSKTSAS